MDTSLMRSARRARFWLLGLGLCCAISACKLERSPADLLDADILDGGDDAMNDRSDASTTTAGRGGSGGRTGSGGAGGASGTGGRGGGTGGVTAAKDAGTDSGQPAMPDETCDGKDNDGDKEIDEDIADVTCGVGACEVTVKGCKDGKVPACKPKAAKDDETCNEIDDDCDGKVDESADEDGDGFTVCDGDCCDAAGTCSTGTTPELVNPGAFEVLNNGVDDDCDEATTDTVKPLCEPEPLDTPTPAKALAQAMELCRFTTAKPKSNERTWGVISAKFFAADHTSTAPDDVQRGVLAQYGPSVLPRTGITMAAISSGTARDEDDTGWKTPEYDENDSWKGGGQGAPPPAYLAAHDGVIEPPDNMDCDYSLANDSIALEMHVRVPTNANSFSLRFKLYSAEYSEWICRDYFLALVKTKADGVPDDHNIAVSGGQPVSIQTASYNICQGDAACTGGATELTGTGMEAPSGGTESLGAGTPWYTASAPVKPGEEMVLELMVWDAFDHYGDTVVLLDGFEWSTATATAGSTQ
jgi:hypothetical protein